MFNAAKFTASASGIGIEAARIEGAHRRGPLTLAFDAGREDWTMAPGVARTKLGAKRLAPPQAACWEGAKLHNRAGNRAGQGAAPPSR